MTRIQPILNGESGLSVRAKLNQLVARANEFRCLTYAFGAQHPDRSLAHQDGAADDLAFVAYFDESEQPGSGGLWRRLAAGAGGVAGLVEHVPGTGLVLAGADGGRFLLVAGETVDIRSAGVVCDGRTGGQARLLHALRDFAIAANVKLVGGGTLLLDEQIDLKHARHDFLSLTFRLCDGFAERARQTTAIVVGGNYRRDWHFESALYVDGNAKAQVTPVVSVKIRDDDGPNSTYVIKGCRFNTLCLCEGNSERNCIAVHGSNGDILYHERAVGTDTPDSNRVALHGSNCKIWYWVQGQVSSNVSFAVESNVDDGGYCVLIETGKLVRLSGAIRAINGHGIKIHEGDSTGTVIFDNLALLHIPRGTACLVDKCRRISGHLYIEDCDYEGGPALRINRVEDAAGFVGHVSHCQARECIRIGAADRAYGGPQGVGFNLAAIANDGAAALVVEAARDIDVRLLECAGNIALEAGARGVRLELPTTFLAAGHSVAAGARDMLLNFKGAIGIERIFGLSWLAGTILVESIRELGGRSARYESGRWAVEPPAGATDAELGDADGAFNTFLKRKGACVFALDRSEPVFASGDTPADPWLNAAGVIRHEPR